MTISGSTKNANLGSTKMTKQPRLLESGVTNHFSLENSEPISSNNPVSQIVICKKWSKSGAQQECAARPPTNWIWHLIITGRMAGIRLDRAIEIVSKTWRLPSDHHAPTLFPNRKRCLQFLALSCEPLRSRISSNSLFASSSLTIVAKSFPTEFGHYLPTLFG